MEFWLLILVLCHATNSIESVNSPQKNVKIYKTFDEIFGEGWGDEEKPKLLESNESQRMEASPSYENYHQNEQNESEKSWDRNDRSEIDLNEVPVELVDSNPLQDQKSETPYSKPKKIIRYSDDQKRELVQKFIELKNKFMQEKKHSQNEWKLFDANIFKELGVGHSTIFKWKKQFGIDKKIKRYSDDRKLELVQEFIELKNKFSQEKQLQHNEWHQFYANIPKELGVSHSTIFKWKNQFFGGNIKMYKDEQKLKKLKEYYEIKLRNPKTIDKDIAADLEISIGTLKNWKFQFKHSHELNKLK